MRITKEQKLQFQEIIRATSLSTTNFEVSSNDTDELQFKFKTNYFTFQVKLKVGGTFYCTIFPVSKIQGYSVKLSWEDVLIQFKVWINEIEKEILIQLDWETVGETPEEVFIDKRPIRQKIKENIEDGNLKVALEMLQKHFEEKDKDIYYSTILRMAELKEIEKMILNGQFTREQASVKKNNVAHSILQISTNIES